MSLLNGLKQLVTQFLLSVVQRQVQQIETGMGNRQVRIAAGRPLDDDLFQKNMIVGRKTLKFAPNNTHFDSFHSQNWNTIRAGQEKKKIFLLL